MNWISFFVKRNYLLLKVNFQKNDKIGGSDIYRYKWDRIKNYRNSCNTSIFIETGTYYGLTVSKFKNSFEKIYSIEIDESLFDKNLKLFKNYSNISILLGDSKDRLPEILNTVKRENEGIINVLFWLDGHCSEGETGIGDEYSPLMKELNFILEHLSRIKPVIIIDDVRLFDGVHYPTLNSIKKLLESFNFNLIIDGDGLICLDPSFK
jgi:hypothetical protein